MHVYSLFFQVASATATRCGLSRGLLGLKYNQINYSDSDSFTHSAGCTAQRYIQCTSILTRATVVRARFLAAAFSDGSYLAHVNGA